MGFGGFLSHPFKSFKKLVHNPADALLGDNIRRSSLYRNVVRPIAKVGTGAGAGFLVGGPVGALAGGLSSALGGGLTNNAFRPLPNLVGPAAAAGLVNFGLGSVLGSGGSGTLATGAPTSILGVSNPLANLGVSSGINAGIGYGSGGISGALNGLGVPTSLSGILGSSTGGAAGSGGALGSLTSGLGSLGGLAQLGGAALSLFGGTEPAAGSLTPQDRQLAIQRQLQLSDPKFVQTQLATLRSDPATQKLLADQRRQITEQVRNEYLTTMNQQLSQSGGFGSSQQMQLEQQMAADLSQRLAQAENTLLLGLLQQQMGTSLSANGSILQQPIDTQLNSTGQLGRTLLGLGG